jgi:hypothetical protein
MGQKMEIHGKALKISDNIHHIEPGEQAFMAFATTGMLLAEVAQLLNCNAEVHLGKEEWDEMDAEEKKSWMDTYPRAKQGFILVGFMLYIYNETRRDKRVALLLDDQHLTLEVEEGEFDVYPRNSFKVDQPMRANIPVYPFLINTTFKDSDKAVLYVHVKNNDQVKMSTAIMNFFAEIDKDKSGEITMQEFVNYCKAKNPKAEEPMIKAMFTRLDNDKSGSVTQIEFIEKHEELVKFIQDINLQFEKKMSKFSTLKKKTTDIFSNNP